VDEPGRHTADVPMLLRLTLKESGLYASTWKSVAPDVHRWASSMGFATDSTTLEIPGENAAGMNAATWRMLSAKIVVTIQVVFERVTIVCERRTPCVDGVYGPALTTTRKLKGQRYSGLPVAVGNGTTEVIGPAEMSTAISRALAPYRTAQAALDQFVQACH
jgi:hypothetical protein